MMEMLLLGAVAWTAGDYEPIGQQAHAFQRYISGIVPIWYLVEAIEHGQRAVEIAPYGIIGRKDLAYAYIDKGDRRDAIITLKPLAQRGVEDPDVWRALAECFEALGDTNNAALARESQRRCEGKL